MQFTRFLKLRKAVADLDRNFIVRQVARIENDLYGRGKAFSPNDTIITEEGIFYIDEHSGLTAKVALYGCNFLVPRGTPLPNKKLLSGRYEEKNVIDSFDVYHLLRCNELTRSQTNSWDREYRVTQRTDGTFYYRLLIQEKDESLEVFQEIEDQKLYVCKNCLLKVNSLLEGIAEYEREPFEPKYFFDVDFAGSWCRYASNLREDEFLGDINPSDWEHICNTRKAQVSYHCESCDSDLSPPSYQKYLWIHRTSYPTRNVAYVRLECLCMACISEKDTYAHLRETPEYEQFLQRKTKGVKQQLNPTQPPSA